MSYRTVRAMVKALLLVIVLVWTTTLVSGQDGTKNGEWRHWGGDIGNTKYSPIDQINRDNVNDLEIAWRWKTYNFGPFPDYNYEATPIMAGNVLYTTAGRRRVVVAIDGVTGETLWMYRYDEGIRGQMAPIRAAAGRGVSYWTDGKEERILHVTPGYHLVALDAGTGRPIPSFGEDGIVDLFEELDQPVPRPGQIGWNSPPLVVGDVVVVGAALGGSRTAERPEQWVKGYVRGYDVRTGKRIWIFHTIPQPGEFGHETWENDSWSYTGHTGVWGTMSADEELGYVYLPVETATNDQYGGHRPGNNLFGESVVCLDASTGKRIWHFQLVHHGLWDFDIPTAATLVDVTVNGKRIKALAQATKQSWVYVFDRATGEPIWPIEELPVPQGDVPGEWYSPTQPFPTKPAPFDRHGVTIDDLIDFTPELRAEAIRIASEYKLGSIFTPPIVAGSNGLRGMLSLPALTGGSNWPGGAVDPETGIFYVVSSTNPASFSVDPSWLADNLPVGAGPAAAVGLADAVRGGRERAQAAAQPAEEAPSRASSVASPVPPPARRGFGPVQGPLGLPLVKPPWGRITAIDLNTGDHVWMVPNGEAPDFVRDHPVLSNITLPRTGRPGRPALMVTKTLLFAGEGSGLLGEQPFAGGRMFRAYDKGTGEVIWEFELPVNQSGVPMTYMTNGKQYIVVPVGARGEPGELVALSLP